MGVQSDILFPVAQQRELNKFLRYGPPGLSPSLFGVRPSPCGWGGVAGGRRAGTPVTYYELDSMYGHDTFLIDIRAVGAAVKGHLEP